MTDSAISPATLGVVVAGGMLGVAVRAALVAPVDDLAATALVTMTINVVGSGLLGVVVGWLDDRRPLLRAFLGTGVLGGFTTYSAFAVQTVQTAGGGGIPAALGLAAASVLGGLVAAAAGLWLGRRIADAPGEIEPPEEAR